MLNIWTMPWQWSNWDRLTFPQMLLPQGCWWPENMGCQSSATSLLPHMLRTDRKSVMTSKLFLQVNLLGSKFLGFGKLPHTCLTPWWPLHIHFCLVNTLGSNQIQDWELFFICPQMGWKEPFIQMDGFYLGSHICSEQWSGSYQTHICSVFHKMEDTYEPDNCKLLCWREKSLLEQILAVSRFTPIRFVQHGAAYDDGRCNPKKYGEQ